MKKKSRGYIFIGVAVFEFLTTLMSIFNLNVTSDPDNIPPKLLRTITIGGLVGSGVVSIILVIIGLYFLIKYREASVPE